MSNIEAFKAFRLAFIKEVKAQDDYQKAKAFGAFERFIEDERNAKYSENQYIQLGPHYSTALDVGRKGKADIKGIYEWLALKKYGLNYATTKQRYWLAVAIARKQEKDGSFKFRNASARTKIIQTAVEKATPTLLKALGVSALTGIRSQVQTEINAINGNANN